MTLRYASYTNTGKREINEDYLDARLINENLIAIVADGLGGHANGEVASRIAVDSILEYLSDKNFDEDELLDGVLETNQKIIKADISGHSTVAVVWIRNDAALISHVGDTRVYQFRNGEIVYQTVDHSVIQLAVTVGDLSPLDLRHHKDRNKLYRVLGDPGTDLKPSSDEVDVRSGDRFLICSDGFWEMVTEDKMLQTLSASANPEAWINEMSRQIAAANAPRQDNYTAICIFCEE